MGWERDAACMAPGMPTDWWFPERAAGQANHGDHAKAICATCPVRRQCLEAALERREQHGIWGGAGGDLLRALGRAWRQGGTVWELAVTRHLDALDHHQDPVMDRNGPGATHALRATYNRACRCRGCRLAASWDVRRQKTRRAS